MKLDQHLKHVILAFIIGAVVLIVSWKIVSHLDNIAHDNRVLAQSKLDNDKEQAKNQSLQTEVSAQQKQQADIVLQSQINTLAASNKSLISVVSSLQSQLSNQRKQDSVMSTSELANRWSVLTETPVQDFQVNSNSIEVPLSVSRTTVDKLEEIPIVEQEFKASQDNSSQKDLTIQKQQDDISAATKLLTSTQSELTTCKQTVKDDENLCSDKIREVKHTALKHGLVYNIFSFVAGMLVRSKI